MPPPPPPTTFPKAHPQRQKPYQHVPAPFRFVRGHFLAQLVLEGVHGLLQELALPVILGQHLLLDAGGVQAVLAVGAVQLLHSFLQGPGGLDELHCALQVPLEAPEATSSRDNHPEEEVTTESMIVMRKKKKIEKKKKKRKKKRRRRGRRRRRRRRRRKKKRRRRRRREEESRTLLRSTDPSRNGLKQQRATTAENDNNSNMTMGKEGATVRESGKQRRRGRQRSQEHRALTTGIHPHDSNPSPHR